MSVLAAFTTLILVGLTWQKLVGRGVPSPGAPDAGGAGGGAE
jgi:hypothetical protein